jgi:F-type H+-transporting ATPase subunit delta
VLELVRGYSTAVFDSAKTGGTLSEVASGLTGIRALLVASEPLRIALSDGGIPSGERQAIVEDLFAGKVDEPTIELLTFSIVTERASEVPKTVEVLLELVETVVAAEDAGSPDPGEPPIGRSGGLERIRGYAERTFEKLSDTDAVDNLEDELFRLARIAEQSPPLREALVDPNSPLERRLAVLADLIEGKVSAETHALTAYVLRSGRGRDFVGALDYLVDLAAEERGRRVAEVRAALELDDDERTRLTEALSRLSRRPVELRVIIDPSVIGGIGVTVGDTVIDGTVRHRLDMLKETLLQPI